ncbi:Protein of unknown function [Bacillus cytotoxicus]|nr:Protein of unknown function [Bacillus cytotoxicus]
MNEVIVEVVIGLCEFVAEVFAYGNTEQEKKEKEQL